MLDGDFLPPDLPPMSDHSVRALGRVVEVTERCNALSAELERQFRSALEACHAVCLAVDTDCLSCISGRLQSILAAANDIGIQCATKLRARVIDLTGNAIAKAAATIDYDPPDTPQALANLDAGVYPLVGPLANVPPPPAPPLQNIEPLKPDRPTVTLPPVIEPWPSLGDLPPPPPAPPVIGIGPNIEPVGPGQCPAPIINVPACPPPPPAPPGPNIQIFPPGPNLVPDGQGGWIVVPTPPAPPVTVNLPPPESWPGDTPPPVVNVEVNVGGPPADRPPPVPDAEGVRPRPVTDVASSWNATACPKPPPPALEDFDGNWFRYLENKTGFHITKRLDGGNHYVAPAGFFSDAELAKPSQGGVIRWWASYGMAVALPAIGATMVPPSGSCNLQLSIADYATILIIEFVEKWVGIDLTNIKQPAKYDINYNCPSYIPGQGEVDQLFQTRWIDENLWRCWTRANNNLDVPRKLAVDASRPRVTPDQAYRLERLYPTDYPTLFTDELKRHGWDLREYEKLLRIHEFIPSATDLVHFMTRDVFDETVFIPFQLDQEFEEKFSGNVKKWAEAQGMSAEKMKLYWRAHWNWPSPSQMYQMVHRWRPDAPGRPKEVDPVLLSDVERVLGINDVAPVWRKRLAYLSYKVVNRLELRRQFAGGIIDEQGFIDGMKDLGYEDRAAKSIMELFKKLNEDNAEKKNRTISIRQIQGWYAEGVITRAEAEDQLSRYRLGADGVYRILNDADRLAAVEIRHQRVANLKRRYTRGEFDSLTAITLLNAAGVDPVRSPQIVSGWDQVIKDKGKHASAAQLCKWLGQNLLTQGEYFERLTNVGWSNEDAARIVASCQLDIVKKNTPKPPKPKPPK